MNGSGPASALERVVLETVGAGVRLASGAAGLAVNLALLPVRLTLRAVLPAPDVEEAPELEPEPEPVRPPRGRRAEPPEPSGPGPEVHVHAPWEGYDRMTAAQVVDRLRGADATLLAMVRLYEERHKARKAVLHRTEPRKP